VSSGEPGCGQWDAPAEPPGSPTAPTALTERLPARPESVSIIRGRLGDWLAALHWPEPELADILLAAGEAVANVADHAYGAGVEDGDVELRAEHTRQPPDQRRVLVTVADHGRWQPPVHPSRYRGHGLTIMRGCVEECRIDIGEDGTAVRLISRPVPA
jgi:serine/threonine-protein kinase RsbW